MVATPGDEKRRARGRLGLIVFGVLALLLVIAAVVAKRAMAEGATPSPQAAAATVLSYTAAQADHGDTIYVQSCAQCHGAHLDDGEFAPALKGPGFAHDWGGKSAAAFLAYIRSQMPPGQAGALPPDDYAAVVAYVLQQNGAPPGGKPLPSDVAALGSAALPR